MQPKVQSRFFNHFDWKFLGCTAVLILLGLLNLYSATYNLSLSKYFQSQLLWMTLGIFIAFIFFSIDYHFFQRLAYFIYFAAIGVLFLVLIIGKTSQGAQRWIQIGSLTIQPSEFSKVCVIFCLARFFHDQRVVMPLSWNRLILPSLIFLLPFALILKEPDLGTALILGGTSLAMILFVGVEKRVLVVLALVLLASAPNCLEIWLEILSKGSRHHIFKPREVCSGEGLSGDSV